MSMAPVNLTLTKLVPPIFRKQRWRRCLVVGMYGAFVGAVFLPGKWLPLLMALLGVGALLLLMGATRSIADLSDVCIDERERQVRDQAYRPAYITLSGVMLLMVLAWGFAKKGIFPMPEFDAVLNGVLFVMASLPTAFVAWREADND